MRLSRFTPTAFLPLLAAFAAPLLFAGASLAQTTPAKVAIANPARIFNEIDEIQDLRLALDAKRKQVENQKLEKEVRLKDLQARRDQLKPDSPQFSEANRELMQAVVDYEVWGRITQQEVQNDQKRQMIHIYNKIANAVSTVATAKSIDLVISDQRQDFTDNLDQLNVEQVRALINTRNLLFFQPQVDISSDVIAQMNADYKAGK